MGQGTVPRVKGILSYYPEGVVGILGKPLPIPGNSRVSVDLLETDCWVLTDLTPTPSLVNLLQRNASISDKPLPTIDDWPFETLPQTEDTIPGEVGVTGEAIPRVGWMVPNKGKPF